jgi:hypothetical protein
MWWQEAKKPIRDAAMLGLGPTVTILILSHYTGTPSWWSSLALALSTYLAFFIFYCLWHLTNSAITLSRVRSLELESLRAFKAQVLAVPLYVGPLNYCLRINGNNVSIRLIVLRNTPVKIVHLAVAVSAKNGKAFSRDFTNPLQIGNTGQIILDDILLQPEEVGRLADTDVFEVIGCATLETDRFHNFNFSCIPLR